MNFSLYFNIIKGYLWTPSTKISPNYNDIESQPEYSNKRVKSKYTDKELLIMCPGT